ncbi:hypothetical protein BDV40DRAFT_279247 [Aspergillus tamarii]|uniref:Uncharacterized protein n=1 Tax=Aspergillus tamarii TaxID=41984 RepID=A0A5N6UEY6_ASPTM|nr:hypothetical protein BDV40DRAFT_279247 [Aspergillus tamarii]
MCGSLTKSPFARFHCTKNPAFGDFFILGLLCIPLLVNNQKKMEASVLYYRFFFSWRQIH